MTLPGDPNLPPGVSTRDTDGAPCEQTCPKCGSNEVSDLHAPDLWCSECDYEWDMRRPEESADPGPLPLEHLAEYDAAAQWCAERGLEGSLGDPLPANMATSGALRWIQADPEAFMKRVKECAYALAMAKVKEQS